MLACVCAVAADAVAVAAEGDVSLIATAAAPRTAGGNSSPF